jgi:8-oxo-dGTP pyrophosphatase MutT (NUDIX family)
LVALTLLLRLCRDEHATLWETINDLEHAGRASTYTESAAKVIAEAAPGPLTPEVRDALADALTVPCQVPGVLVARHLAVLLDEHYAGTFDGWFRSQSPYRPTVGDPVPVRAPDARQFTDLPITPPPWRLANRLDETRTIRLAGGWANQFDVTIDYSHADALIGLVGPDTIIATCHPNRNMSEFITQPDQQGQVFPIVPRDQNRQSEILDSLMTKAAQSGATIVVLPELSVPETLHPQLRAWTTNDTSIRLVVAGSYHCLVSGPGESAPPRRVNRAVAFMRGCPHVFTHEKHSPADRPVPEAIQPSGRPALWVYPTSDGYRIALAICRDLLNPAAVHALAELGVNLILAPAMTETLVAFGGPAAQLVGANQAFVAIANGPTEFGATIVPRALVGHPGYDTQVRHITSRDPGPGLALMSVRTGEIRWHTISPPQASATRPSPATPGWAAQLRDHCLPAQPYPAVPDVHDSLRESAVLVLLIDTDDGPRVLLTERAAGLRNYPGQIVFPGGAADARDDGPADTALREAHEEVGVEAADVEILGCLPPLLLRDSGFVLTPVVAWAAATPSVTPNPAEVSNVHLLPLDSCGRGTQESGAALGRSTRAVLDLLRGAILNNNHARTPPMSTSPAPRGRTTARDRDRTPAGLRIKHVGH